jgi:carbon-monoxide dehydrogenase medium subunit
VKPSSFEYHAPDTAEEVVALLAEFGDDAKVLAGGQSLVPMLSLRLTSFEHLVDIRRIAGLDRIDHQGAKVRVGAKVTEAAVERSEVIHDGVPLLSRSTPHIGHFQIRNRGTLCGSIAHADPAAEYPAVAVALDAEMEVLSPEGTRTIPAADFFVGLWTTSLHPTELLTAVTFPIWGGRHGFGFTEFARRHGDFAVAGAAVGIEVDEGGVVTRCAIGLMGLSSIPERARTAEASVLGSRLDQLSAREVGHLAMADLGSVTSDLHGSAEYRAWVGTAMVERAWQEAESEVLHG